MWIASYKCPKCEYKEVAPNIHSVWMMDKERVFCGPCPECGNDQNIVVGVLNLEVQPPRTNLLS